MHTVRIKARRILPILGLVGFACSADPSISRGSPGSSSVTINNYSFETPSLPQNGSFQYGPTNAGWTFTPVGSGNGGSGVATPQINPSASFGGYTPPDGVQYGYLQRVGSISQTLTFPSTGTYVLSLYLAGRPYNENVDFPNDGNQDVGGYLDGNSIFYQATTTNQPFTLYTADFNATAGPHVLSLAGLLLPNDETALVDDVTITAVPEPEILGVLGIAGIGLLGRRRRQRTSY
jgi:hypothetical protein